MCQQCYDDRRKYQHLDVPWANRPENADSTLFRTNAQRHLMHDQLVALFVALLALGAFAGIAAIVQNIGHQSADRSRQHALAQREFFDVLTGRQLVTGGSQTLQLAADLRAVLGPVDVPGGTVSNMLPAEITGFNLSKWDAAKGKYYNAPVATDMPIFVEHVDVDVDTDYCSNCTKTYHFGNLTKDFQLKLLEVKRGNAQAIIDRIHVPAASGGYTLTLFGWSFAQLLLALVVFCALSYLAMRARNTPSHPLDAKEAAYRRELQLRHAYSLRGERGSGRMMTAILGILIIGPYLLWHVFYVRGSLRRAELRKQAVYPEYALLAQLNEAIEKVSQADPESDQLAELKARRSKVVKAIEKIERGDDHRELASKALEAADEWAAGR